MMLSECRSFSVWQANYPTLYDMISSLFNNLYTLTHLSFAPIQRLRGFNVFKVQHTFQNYFTALVTDMACEGTNSHDHFLSVTNCVD